MSNIIAYFIFVFFVGIYYLYKKRINRRFGESPISRKIEQIYRKWYRRNGRILNKSVTKVPEINKVLFELKEKIEEQGITKDHVIFYIETLKKPISKVGIKDFIIAILGYLMTNEIVKKQLEIIDFKTINNLISQILQDQETIIFVKNIILFILIFVIVASLIFLTYIIATLDTIHKDNQRMFVLNSLTTIWNYDVIEDIQINENNLRTDVIYKNFKFSESNLDKIFNLSIGEGAIKNFNIVSEIMLDNSNDRIKFGTNIGVFCLGFFFPILFEICFSFFYYLLINTISQFNINILASTILIFGSGIILPIIYLMLTSFYNSQIDIFAKRKDSATKTFLGRSYFEKKITWQNWIQLVIHLIISVAICIFYWNNTRKMISDLFIISFPVIILYVTAYFATRYSFEE